MRAGRAQERERALRSAGMFRPRSPPPVEFLTYSRTRAAIARSIGLLPVAAIPVMPGNRHRGARHHVSRIRNADPVGGARQSLGPAPARHHRHDGGLEPAVRLGAVHRSAEQGARHHARRDPVDCLAADHSPDLLLAVPGVPGRPLRAQAADLGRCDPVGRQLGAGVAGDHPDDALSHLRGDRRLRHRHHLCRHHRPDGALVPGPARPRHRSRGGRLRLRRGLHQLSDLRHDRKLRLRPRAAGVGHRPGRDRRRRRARPADAADRLPPGGL